jgi:hypothetical protein
MPVGQMPVLESCGASSQGRGIQPGEGHPARGIQEKESCGAGLVRVAPCSVQRHVLRTVHIVHRGWIVSYWSMPLIWIVSYWAGLVGVRNEGWSVGLEVVGSSWADVWTRVVLPPMQARLSVLDEMVRALHTRQHGPYALHMCCTHGTHGIRATGIRATARLTHDTRDRATHTRDTRDSCAASSCARVLHPRVPQDGSCAAS